MASAGTWNVSDLPPPVGISPRVSCPLLTDVMISGCISLKES